MAATNTAATSPAAPAPAPLAPSRIGPNAITRMAEALRDRLGPAPTAALFAAADIAHWLADPPETMVDEAHVIALHRVVRERLDAEVAAAVSHDAGRRTADYLLANRIPKPVQALLKRLPAAAASPVLLSAIGRHSWTFAGSGRFSVRRGRPVAVAIADCPLCRGATASAPVCAYYAGTFERLYRVLVSRRTVVTETACQALGDPACVFTLDWSGG